MPLPLLLAALLSAEPELLWPLEFDDGLASSFGELRGDRLHTGVDLKTRGETGFPVHAAAAGAVTRIKEEWRGYGLALYLEHPGGRVTVYAHLERVAPDLETRLRAARRRLGSPHAGDVTIDPPRPVARGEVVAWSGETGAGLPHLHFEVRQGMDRPIDPFAAGLAPPRDDTPPVAESLVIEPLEGATVNGRREALVLALSGSRGRYGATVGERPVVAGPFRLYLRAYDRAGAENWAGVSAIEARLDGDELLRLGFDAIPFAASQTAGAVLDLARSHIGPSWYTYRLTRLEGADLPFARGREGPITLAPGLHRLEVTIGGVVSTTGPRASVRVDIAADAAPPAQAPAPAAPAASELRPGSDARVALGPLTLRAGGGDVYAPVSIRSTSAAAMTPQGLAALSPLVALLPDGHPFRAPVEIEFESGGGGSRRAGIYRFDPYDGSWELEAMGARARVRRLAAYALLEDQAAPRIRALRPSDGSEVAPGPLVIEAEVTDLGSGVPLQGIAISADGVALAVDYDPDRETARAPWQAGPGEHAIAIKLTDRAGNAATATSRIVARSR